MPKTADLAAIDIYAGKVAYQQIANQGLTPADIGIVAGAAGGPKWLVLHGLDKYLFGEWLPRSLDPIDLLGSSIGAWRYACYCQEDFERAFSNFERIYFSQTYPVNASRKQVSDEVTRLLHELFPTDSIKQILNNQQFRLNLFADLSRGPIKSENDWLLGAGLLFATLLNMIHPATIKWFFKRTLFQHPESPQLIKDSDYATLRQMLDEHNLADAILASGAIPMVIEGVKMAQPGCDSTRGVFRDGGLIDYHMTAQYDLTDKLVLMPHFSPRLISTWLDKYVPWRSADISGMDRVIVITPSADFIQSLPLSKIPDRTDFERFKGDDKARISYWKQVIERSKELADAWHICSSKDLIGSVVKPLESLRR